MFAASWEHSVWPYPSISKSVKVSKHSVPTLLSQAIWSARQNWSPHIKIHYHRVTETVPPREKLSQPLPNCPRCSLGHICITQAGLNGRSRP